MTPPKTFLRSILPPRPRPGGNLLLALGWHQPPSPPTARGCDETTFKPQHRICRPAPCPHGEMEPGACGRPPAQQPPTSLRRGAQQGRSQQATSCHPPRGWGATGHLPHWLILGDGHFMAHKANAFSFSDAQEEVRPAIDTSPPLERINPPYLLTLHATTWP